MLTIKTTIHVTGNFRTVVRVVFQPQRDHLSHAMGSSHAVCVHPGAPHEVTRSSRRQCRQTDLCIQRRLSLLLPRAPASTAAMPRRVHALEPNCARPFSTSHSPQPCHESSRVAATFAGRHASSLTTRTVRIRDVAIRWVVRLTRHRGGASPRAAQLWLQRHCYHDIGPSRCATNDASLGSQLKHCKHYRCH